MPPHRPHFVVAAALVLLFADAGSATVADRSTAPWGSVLSPPQALKNLQTGWTPEGGGHGAVLQRLRGGGCMDWFSCFGSIPMRPHRRKISDPGVSAEYFPGNTRVPLHRASVIAAESYHSTFLHSRETDRQVFSSTSPPGWTLNQQLSLLT